MDKDKFFEKLGITPGGWEIERFSGQKPYLIGTNKSVVCVFGSHNRIKNQFVEGDTKMLAASKQMFLVLIDDIFVCGCVNHKCDHMPDGFNACCNGCRWHEKICATIHATGKTWEEIKTIYEECKE